MKKNATSNSNGKLTAYSAMAAAFVATANDAEAQVIYNDIEDVAIELFGSYNLDMDGDAVIDFHFRASTLGSGSWTFGSVGGSATSLGVGGPQNLIAGYSGSFYYYASIIAEGDAIDGGLAFDIPASSFAVLASNFYGSLYGAFGDEGPNFMGVQFAVGDNIHYGWIRVDVTMEPLVINILDYAFNATPETSIEAGQTQSVDLENLDESQVLVTATGHAIQIHTSAFSENMFAEVYDCNGKCVAKSEISALQTNIHLNQSAAGVYIVKLYDGNTFTTKKVAVSTY